MILGIESSCDDSSVALMDKNSLELVYYEKISQENEHSKFGGVVPELAARLHTTDIPNLISNTKPYFDKIKAISVSNEPGLSVSLLSGVSAAKSLSLALNLPLIGINHLIGHIYSLFLHSNLALPLGVLLVSGGHTMILSIDKNAQISLLANTSDDSFGESFDKVAKMLGFGYPGGKIIEDLAKTGDENKFNFTIPLKNTNRLEYSFSGLKNQLREQIEKLKSSNLLSQEIPNLAASFQKTAILHIIDRLNLVFQTHKFNKFGIVGGASANQILRQHLLNLCTKFDCELLMSEIEFCSDNAAMIARAGVDRYKNKAFDDLDMQIYPRSNLQAKFLDRL
nr:tRNA (adenosine(37)-N6)-threonylcarbamoyltransferase complex transferase subunit TsaD [Campylobacter sp.]